MVVGWKLPSVSRHVNFSRLLHLSKHVRGVRERIYEGDGRQSLSWSHLRMDTHYLCWILLIEIGSLGSSHTYREGLYPRHGYQELEIYQELVATLGDWENRNILGQNATSGWSYLGLKR